MPCALVIEPDGERHRYVGDVVIVEPIAEAEFQCVETGGYRAHECRKKDIFTARVLFLLVYIKLDHEEHEEEPVECVDFHDPEIEGNECEYKKYGEFDVVQPAQNESVALVEQRLDMPYCRPFEQCDGDHARKPARYLTDFAGHVQKTMPQNPAYRRSNSHKKEEVLDLLVHAVRAAQFVEVKKGVNAHSGHHEARQHRRGLHNGYSEQIYLVDFAKIYNGFIHERKSRLVHTGSRRIAFEFQKYGYLPSPPKVYHLPDFSLVSRKCPFADENGVAIYYQIINTKYVFPLY